MRPPRRIQGVTLVEVVTAASLTAVVLTTSVAVFLYAAYNWIHGEAHVLAESDSSLAIQAIDRQLREAILVTVDSNGKGLTYEMPQHNADGSYTVPQVWDNVTRRVALSGTNLVMSGSDGTSQTLARSIYSYDPLAAPALTPYAIFTPNAGSTVRSITVMIVTTQSDGHGTQITSRSREAIYLRNVPKLTQ